MFIIQFYCIQQLILIIFIRYTKSRPVYFMKKQQKSEIQSAVFLSASFQASGVKMPWIEEAKEAICRTWQGSYFLGSFNAMHSWVPPTGILLTIYIRKEKVLL